MLGSTIFKSLGECVVKDSVIYIPGTTISGNELQEFKQVLRRLVLTGRVPHYRPIKVLVEGVDAKTVIECPRGLSNSYLDMIPILKEAVLATDHNGFDSELAGCDWPQLKKSRQFDASLALERGREHARQSIIPEESLFTARYSDYGDIYVDDLMVSAADQSDKRYLDVKLKPLAADSPPINRIAVGSNAKVSVMWAQVMGEITHETIDRSTRELSAGISIEQSAALSNLFIPMLSESEHNTISMLYKRKINEDVLQSILQYCGWYYWSQMESDDENDLIYAEESFYGWEK